MKVRREKLIQESGKLLKAAILEHDPEKRRRLIEKAEEARESARRL